MGLVPLVLWSRIRIGLDRRQLEGSGKASELDPTFDIKKMYKIFTFLVNLYYCCNFQGGLVQFVVNYMNNSLENFKSPSVVIVCTLNIISLGYF